MPSKHKTPLVGYHPPGDQGDWLRSEAKRRGVSLAALLTEAVERLRQDSTVVTTSRRKAAPAADRTVQRPRVTIPDAAEFACPHPPGRRLKHGTYCGACGQTVSDEKKGKR